MVEILKGFVTFDQKFYLQESDYNLVFRAEKPKLMKVSMKSWHYRLLKYVLRSNAPTPKTMQNGCPYFWLLIFSVLVVPFVFLFHVFVGMVKGVLAGIDWLLKVSIDKWIAKLDDILAYDMYYNGNMPKTAKLYFHDNDYKFFDYFLSKKYGDNLSNQKKEEIAKLWEKWTEEVRKKRNEHDKYLYELRAEQERKRLERKAKWDARMKPITDKLNNFWNGLKKTFTFERGKLSLIILLTI